MRDYDPRCFMFSGLMFNDIIMNIIRNKELECHKEEVDCFLKNIGEKNIICTGGNFNTFTRRK